MSNSGTRGFAAAYGDAAGVRLRIARFLRMPKYQAQKSARQLIKNSYLKRSGRRSKVSAMQERAILLLQSESIDAQWFRIGRLNRLVYVYRYNSIKLIIVFFASSFDRRVF